MGLPDPLWNNSTGDVAVLLDGARRVVDVAWFSGSVGTERLPVKPVVAAQADRTGLGRFPGVGG